MRKAIIIWLLSIILCGIANAQDGDFDNRLKHGLVGVAVSGTITQLCHHNVKLLDGSRATFGCWGLGIIPTVIGAALFEALQDDKVDASGDVAAGAIGAIVGSTISITIDF